MGAKAGTLDIRLTRIHTDIQAAVTVGPHASPAAGGGGASRTSLRLAVAAASNSSSFSLIVATGISEAFRSARVTQRLSGKSPGAARSS